MAIPPCPTAYFILIQPDLPLGRFKAALHGPSAPGHPHHRLQSAFVGSKHHVGCQVREITHTPPYQQPAAPCWEQGMGQGPPAPLIPAESLGPRAGTASEPTVGGQRRQPRFHLVLAPPTPDIFLPQNRQDIRLGALLQPHPPPPIIAIDA